jgi:excisionase family DNA binding protein
MPTDGEDVLTLAEAANLLGILPSTLERWAREGRIPSQLTAGGVRVFQRSDLLSRSVRTDDLRRGQD